jgi:tetratricopeptide (TPR) repeat protein
MGQKKRALEHYRHALRYLPHDPDLNSNLGNLLYEFGQYDRAMAAYQRVLKSRPTVRFKDTGQMLPRSMRPKPIEE